MCSSVGGKNGLASQGGRNHHYDLRLPLQIWPAKYIA